MRISDWSSDVCSSDLKAGTVEVAGPERLEISIAGQRYAADPDAPIRFDPRDGVLLIRADGREFPCWPGDAPLFRPILRTPLWRWAPARPSPGGTRPGFSSLRAICAAGRGQAPGG